MTTNYNLTEDNVNDNNINESNTNAEVSSMVMVGLGGRNLERFKRSADLLKEGSTIKLNFFFFIFHLFSRKSSLDHLGPAPTCDEKSLHHLHVLS